MKKMTKSERKEKRKALRPWKGLTIWGIILALTFSIFTPMFHIFDNDFMLVIPGSLWNLNGDTVMKTLYESTPLRWVAEMNNIKVMREVVHGCGVRNHTASFAFFQTLHQSLQEVAIFC